MYLPISILAKAPFFQLNAGIGLCVCVMKTAPPFLSWKR